MNTNTIVVEAFKTVLDKEKNIAILIKKLQSTDSKKPDKEHDKEYTRAVYQIIGDILTNGSDIKSLKEISIRLKNKRIGWDHPVYDKIREKIEEYDDYLVNPFDVAEGIAECRKCGSKKTFSNQKQTRSSDEPMTTFTKCANCGDEWTYSG